MSWSKWRAAVAVGTDLTSTPKHYVTPSACFPSGAEVQTPEGSKPIQSLRLGDKVVSLYIPLPQMCPKAHLLYLCPARPRRVIDWQHRATGRSRLLLPMLPHFWVYYSQPSARSTSILASSSCKLKRKIWRIVAELSTSCYCPWPTQLQAPCYLSSLTCCSITWSQCGGCMASHISNISKHGRLSNFFVLK